MLIRATIENFKSFDEETKLVMVSSSKIRRKDDHVEHLDGAKVLKYAAVYGANAAGKSNLIDFFAFIQQVLKDGLDISSSSCYCRNKEANKKRGSTFEIQFSVGSHVYAYGFTAVLSEMSIQEEWLYELHVGSATRLLAVDASVSIGSVTSDIDFSDAERGRFEMYADDFTPGAGALFLSELNRAKRYVQESNFIKYVEAYTWIRDHIVVITPTMPPRDVRYLLSDGGIERAGNLLASFDTGVTAIRSVPMSPEAFVDAAGEQSIEQIRMDANERFRQSRPGKIRGCLQMRDGIYFFDIDPSGISNISALRLKHRSATSLFDFHEESDGTRRLFDLMGLLLDDAEDTLYVVDELERSLHPKLVRRFLETFMERNAEKSSQIVFSSHEASIMDQELFRRDEIWFVNRDGDGNSKLYSLDRFKDRFDKDIAKAYLEGRYGAIPAITLSESEGE